MRLISLMSLMLLIPLALSAQNIKIGGNVYGGGNHAEVRGSAKVTVREGDLQSVFGGARMANVGGHTFVNIDGEHATGDIMAVSVYGGNDISGTIGTPAAVNEEVPTELTDDIPTEEDRASVTPVERKPYMNVVNDTWNCFVRTSRSTEVVAGKTVEKYPIVIGSIYGGGNGDFTYTDEYGDSLRDDKGNYIAKEDDEIIAVSSTPLNVPEIDKTYLELKGGCAGHVYGGGNNATVRVNTTLNVANESSDLLALAKQYKAKHPDVEVADILGYYQNKVRLNSFQSNLGTYAYNYARVYGGNNRAEMAIRPTWNLQKGIIRDIYSGGNRGNMTSPEGLLLEVNPVVDSLLRVDNVFGGCRMADVKPTLNGEYFPCMNLPGYKFPNGLSARTLIRGGHITNVYGGNDITGTVYGGNAVGIYTTVYGDVYGGGNGAYAYTNKLGEDENSIFHDFYYSDAGSTPIDALNAHRPNAEQVSIRLAGREGLNGQKDTLTVIHGSVYVGGNSASIAAKKKNPLIELKIGSYVVADNVYLGNNGEKMADKNILSLYAGTVDENTGALNPSSGTGTKYSSIGLTDKASFAKYMEGVAMKQLSSIVFDSKANGDPEDYKEYSSYIGSFFCGGNVGSMAIPGKMSFSVNRGLNIFSKFVGGCNSANVEAQDGLNAAYEGGIIGSEDERDSYTDDGKIKDRLEINFENMTVVPMRWNNTFTLVADGTTLTEGKEYYTTNLRSSKFIAKGTEVADATSKESTYYELTAYGTKFEWNTAKWSTEKDNFICAENNDATARLLNGNIYGGCYNSGHVNGNVVININEDVVKKDQIFKDFGNSTTNDAGYTKPAVAFVDQRDDVLAIAMSVFGAGYGEDTEVWGSTTVNHNNGYAFQIFGGGEEGVVGKKTDILDEHGEYKESIYEYNPSYSTTVNLSATATASSNEGEVADIAEAEYLYGGGNMGNVNGNSYVNLGNGRIYDAFGGASDADILGHTEVYIGRQPNGSGGYKAGFPWVRDIVYGGNDFGGTIHGEYEDGYNFEARLRDYATDKTQLHGYKDGQIPDVLKSSSYVEYLQGRVDSIFGGGYGHYDYSNTALYGEGVAMPKQHSAFVNIRPNNHGMNSITSIFGGSTGYPGDRRGDEAQNRSYVLIDIPDGMTNFGSTVVFGAGSYNGIGMGQDKDKLANGTLKLDEASSIVDLLRGRIRNVYGGSYFEGNTRRTVVNVPAASSIQVDNIFGGAYGMYILPPCDVYETQVNYKNTSEKAQVSGAIYGGNNYQRRSLFTQVNISSPVWSNKEKGYTGTVYGAGRGYNTWAEYTEVNLEKGARLYNVYGGAELGHVLNSASVQAYQNAFLSGPSEDIKNEDSYWKTADLAGEGVLDKWKKAWKNAWSLGKYYEPNADWSNYAANAATNLAHVSERAELDDKTAAQLDGQKKHNTNVIIKEGAVVEGYAYGGGLGSSSEPGSGDVYGTTYIAVLGGEVKKDVYAGGRAGGVDNLFGVNDFAGHKFVASANAYIMGGTARNVYGGGYEGDVGHHDGSILASYATDRPALSYVVIGKSGTNTFTGGAPAITRNVYGGGEGGSLYGTSHVTLNNGYVGYRYNSTTKKYVEELDDQNPGDLDLSGNVFGGGYVINSYVDTTNIKMYGGTVRGSLYGGGEIGPIGRGSIRYNATGCLTNGNAHIRHAGLTNVTMYDGKVLRNVFGGGRGKDSWGGDGTMYMNPSVVATLDMGCKGFVFGQTRVNIHGGEIGTDEGMAYGYGNVFGGGDEGTVYSAYMNIAGATKTLHVGNKQGTRYDGSKEGYYYQGETTALTEDCKVVVEPHAQAYVPITINGNSYKTGDYVPTSDLNTLKNKTAGAAYWDNLDPDGIIIHNAVFAGGNLAAGSSSLFANSTTVYGNATASIHDVYNRDLITIGTGHTGGLYGDGNLTFVDGYRELNITNYGTDYYHIAKSLTYDEYKELPEREKAYYELKYRCLVSCTDNAGTTYGVGSTLSQDEILDLFAGNATVIVDGKPSSTYWKEEGVVSVYAGRIMNTIQRADLCGVFGSRMVMRGAQDRVPEEADYTNYTINRVREVSLNKKDTKAGDTGDNATHGNYFGIYSKVNYLGALTSDVRFDTIRTTKSDDPKAVADGKSFYAWKELHKTDKLRNNGNCHNHLALASGVYLELTTEESTGNTLDTKVWGPITGVVELDLINVQPGMGGGFVYAKNIHGKPKNMRATRKTTTLTDLNKGAATKWEYDYIETNPDLTGVDAEQMEWETSGNFIHSSQTIVDDCYNISNRYELGKSPMPAHYWYIAGSVYVYDQYISAYTGSPNAFRETVEVPITISAAAHGTMTLLDVQPNFYAYYQTYTSESSNTPLGSDQKIVINDVTYQKNDPISYWDWSRLTAGQKQLFVKETYVTTAGCKIGNDTIYAGTVMIPGAADKPGTYKAYKAAASTTTINEKTVKVVTSNGKEVPFDEIFRSSNNMSHGTGYLLTYNVTNPSIWDKWYTKKVNTTSGVVESNQTGGSDYEDGPTYYPTDDGLYGQQSYDVNAIIPNTIYNDYQTLTTSHTVPSGQATFVPAYLVTKEYDSGANHYYPGAPVSTAKDGFTSGAYVSTATIQLSPTEYIYVNDLMTSDKKTEYYNRFKVGGPEENAQIAKDIEELILPAYICTTAGLYGGKYYLNANNYRALEAYSAMSSKDRKEFNFNYDALDLLVDSLYGGTVGQKYQYDSEAATLAGAKANDAHYSLTRPINYIAAYGGSAISLPTGVTVKVIGKKDPVSTLNPKDTLLSTEFEKLPNEQHHYAAIQVAKASKDTLVYVVKESFVHGDKAYAVGVTVDSIVYKSLTPEEQSSYISGITFKVAQSDKTYYYCREPYIVGEKGGGVKPAIVNIDGYTDGGIVKTTNQEDSVTVGTIINEISNGADMGYASLPNYQIGFSIQGESPMETSTLYVARNADINDLSTEKIITVIYRYDYEESDDNGAHVIPVTERHVLNIHITFKSGVPTVEDINPPTTVLPGTGITMRIPSVTPGAYEITGGGWEIFEKENDAESHINGVPYTPSVDPLYWYQDGFYLAYYAKTYLGKTYSNYVPVSVANYHDLKRVMDDKQNHLHVDYDRTRLKRDSKIYINDYSASSENGLQLFKDFYDLSVITSSTPGITTVGDSITNADHKLKGHHLLNTSTEEVTMSDGSKLVRGVKGGNNLEFFLRTDIDHSSSSWTSIGTDDQCFKGTLHGDGHTISGLDNSLFNNLCGEVYNLGVRGSFNSAGVADKGIGYVESAWVKTTGTTAMSTKPYAVFGDPTDSKGSQIVNSYFYDGNNNLYNTTTTDGVTTSGGDRGKARAMTAQEFYNGTVAYDLNNFYLYKRYNDGKNTASGVEYKYWKSGMAEPQTGHYAQNEALCSSGYNDNKGSIKYVEERFADGDFVFAAGEIPTAEDERHYVDAEGKSYYFPIWPDDYIFFGQKLTYGWAAQAHQNVPTAVARADGRLSDGDDANRVYRAPAYYRSNKMSVAHFNPHAYLAQTQKDVPETKAYPEMTAIDFKGHKDLPWPATLSVSTVSAGLPDGGTAFYPPLLDDDGLLSIRNCDETQNLLVYAPSADDNAKTYGVLTSYFTEPVYADYYDNTAGYRLVSEASAASVHGHLVQSDKTAVNDHLLVDRQDFNAPFAYTFDANHLMWYQRLPADKEYVDLTKGWQGISIPFTAELVTTDTKGEITHFFSGSAKGHEYWLREYNDIAGTTDPAVAKATFNYPTADGGSPVINKTATNTFLWDYYYKNESLHNQLDKNADTYLQYRQYYKDSRSYAGYPLLTAATPYIIGFPGQTYYEFDLSGKFDAENTAVTIPRLNKQIITFASGKGASIGESDKEMVEKKVTKSVTFGGTSYTCTFQPSYMNENLEAGSNSYVLDEDGDSYDKVGDAAVAVSAFRPYFVATTAVSSSSKSFRTKKIIFGGTDNELREGPETLLDGSLEIFTRGYNIVTISHLKEATAIRIVNAAGATLKDYVLQPGETIETTVPNTGVYVVNKKKVFVE